MDESEFLYAIERQSYNADNLYGIWFAHIKGFLLDNITRKFNGVRIMDILEGTDIKRKPSVAAMLIICSRFYSNADILQAFYRSQADEDKKIIEGAVWSGSISYREVNEIYGREVVYVQTNNREHYGPKYSLYRDKAFEKWFAFLSWKNPWNPESAEAYLRESNPRLIFPALMRRVYSGVLPKPEGYYLNPVSVPDDLTIFSAEEAIFREMPLIIAYYVQGNIRYTQKGYPNAASGRKMTKSLLLKDFPGGSENGLRALMIAGLFTDKFSLESLSEPPLPVLHQLFSTNFTRNPVAPYLLSHLKGLATFHHRDFNRSITEDLFKVFQQIPTDKWISFENIKEYASTHFINLQAIISYYDLDKLSLADEIRYTSDRISKANVENYVNTPILAGHIYLLAAFGLMELAIKENAPLVYSYYDGLYACRLTELGAHILGLKADYTPPESNRETNLLFDENGPNILVEGNLALGDAMLDKYAVKVSGNRYQFSPGKFLKDCKTQGDLAAKITFFKQTVGHELPPFWNDYLEQLNQNSKVINRKNNVIVYKLPAEDKTLHRLIAQDSLLRPLIIKAEQFYIVIEKNKEVSFINRLKELGYLIG